MTASGAATASRPSPAAPRPFRPCPAAAPTAGLGFAMAFSTFVALAAGLALLAPLELAIAIVFLFAGPHNWLEARYMLGRLPARAGRLRGFLFLAVGGAGALAAAFAALPLGVAAGGDPGLLQAVWNTALVAWVALLVELRSRTPPRFATDWVHPLAALLVLAQWSWPWAFGLALVFLHPLVALAVLQRELRRSRPAWRAAWPWCLAAVAAGVLAIWIAGAAAPAIDAGGGIAADVARHAGADLLAGASSRCLVATHAFLELVHYGIWIVVLPLVGMRSAPWRLEGVPLARRGRRWAGAVAGLLACGLLVVCVLWACFLVDYQATRRIYFTVAVLHVLAEIPFLLRMP